MGRENRWGRKLDWGKRVERLKHSKSSYVRGKTKVKWASSCDCFSSRVNAQHCRNLFNMVLNHLLLTRKKIQVN